MFLTVQVEVREERSAALGETHWEVMVTIVTRAPISSTSRLEVESFENILISLNVWGAIIDAVKVSQAACGVWKYGTAPPNIDYSGSWRWSYFRIAQIIGKLWAQGGKLVILPLYLVFIIFIRCSPVVSGLGASLYFQTKPCHKYCEADAVTQTIPQRGGFASRCATRHCCNDIK